MIIVDKTAADKRVPISNMRSGEAFRRYDGAIWVRLYDAPATASYQRTCCDVGDGQYATLVGDEMVTPVDAEVHILGPKEASE